MYVCMYVCVCVCVCMCVCMFVIFVGVNSPLSNVSRQIFLLRFPYTLQANSSRKLVITHSNIDNDEHSK